MKKFRLAAVAALVFAVTALTGCEVFKEFSYNKWCTKPVTVAEGKTTDAYFYWATENKDDNIKAGLNVVIQLDGESVSVLGTEVTNGKYYIVKNIPDGTALKDIDATEVEGDKYEKFKDVTITSGKWAAAYATVFKKGTRNVDEPACLSSSEYKKPGADEEANVSIKAIVVEALEALLEAAE